MIMAALRLDMLIMGTTGPSGGTHLSLRSLVNRHCKAALQVIVRWPQGAPQLLVSISVAGVTANLERKPSEAVSLAIGRLKDKGAPSCVVRLAWHLI